MDEFSRKTTGIDRHFGVIEPEQRVQPFVFPIDAILYWLPHPDADARRIRVQLETLPAVTAQHDVSVPIGQVLGVATHLARL